ncbi:hypothetical protein ACFQ46_20535 [Kineococcus sp. GCM10028916]|uniref:hypothetical protein n=1 Tax=Kineococcus sp. GCM10028916 TaxID=3273394 RepID=UPI00363C7546
MTTELARQEPQNLKLRIRRGRSATAALTLALAVGPAGPAGAAALPTSSTDAAPGTGMSFLLLLFGALSIVALLAGPGALRMVRSVIFPSDPEPADAELTLTRSADEPPSSPNERPADDQ